jgi:uncharacterized protein (TIGR03437 family)
MGRSVTCFWITFASGVALSAQTPPNAPVVSSRGVVNAYSQVPAPSRVSPGGIIWINGFNLGPPQAVVASGVPLPTELAGVKVLINNREAPLFSVSPNRIEAQVPMEIANATANVVVVRGEASSRPARISVVALDPAIRSARDLGYGEAASNSVSGDAIVVRATGLGAVEPRPLTGEISGVDATLVNPIRAFIGGLSTSAIATPSQTRPGEFDITITVPPQAQPGDLLTVVGGGQANVAASPRRLYKTAPAPMVRYLPLPAPPPDLRAFAGSDLRGEFAMAAGPRGDDGCYAAYRIDFAAMTFALAEPCVTAGNRNQPNPFTPAVEGSAIAALLGPPAGELPSGVSSSVAVFTAGSSDALRAELPALAINVGSQGGSFRAALVAGSTPPAVNIDAESAEVTPAVAGPGGGGGGGQLPGGGGAIGANAGCLNPNLTVDLGDGLTKIISCIQAGQLFAAVIADDENAPKKAKFATMTAQGQIQNSADFPAGYLPIVLPALAVQQPPGGGAGPGGGAVVNRIRAVSILDANTVYVLVRSADGSKDALVSFGGQQPSSVIPFPDGWFAAACSPQLRVLTLDLARQFAIPAAKIAESQNKPNCPAFGFVLFDRDTRRMSVSESPGADGFNAASQGGDLADFVYTVSTNPQRVAVAESLYILDGTNGSAFRLDLPPGVQGFGQLRPELSLLTLFAPANATPAGNGDAGIAVFEIESASARLLPTPDGFANMQILTIFESSRKLLARGNRAGGAGSSLLLYDLVSGDLFMPTVPAGCVFAGVVPGAAGGGQPPQAALNVTLMNPKANSAIVGCFDGNRRLNGFLFLKAN